MSAFDEQKDAVRSAYELGGSDAARSYAASVGESFDCPECVAQKRCCFVFSMSINDREVGVFPCRTCNGKGTIG